MSFNGKVFIQNLIEILPYLKVTFLMTFLTFVISLILGLLAARQSFSKSTFWRSLSRFYVNITRCIPPIVLLFVVYYGLPVLVKNTIGADINSWDALFYAVISQSLLHGASMAEMMRAAYSSVNKGQREAGLSIGLSEFQTFYRITFWQALRVALPILGNTIIAMLKDGALAYTIGVVDITGRASYLISMNLGGYVMETYLGLALIYWILAFGIKKLFSLTKRRKGGATWV